MNTHKEQTEKNNALMLKMDKERQLRASKNTNEKVSAPSEAVRNDPNANYAAYELDRVAKRKAQEPAKAEKHTFEQGSFGPTTKPLCKHCGLSDKAQSHFGPRSSKAVEHPEREDSGSTPDADALQASIEAIHKEIQSSLTEARQTPEYLQEGIELDAPQPAKAAQSPNRDTRIVARMTELASELERVKQQRDGLLAAAKAALNDVNTARRHVYTGSSANPDDMTFDAIENTLEPSTRLLQSAIAAAEGEVQS